MSRRRLTVAIAAITMLFMVLAGCSSANKAANTETAASTASNTPTATESPTPAPTKDPNAEPFTITVSSWLLADDTEGKDPDAHVKNFKDIVTSKFKEKYPNATI